MSFTATPEQSAKQLHYLFEEASLGIAVEDLDGKLLRANPALCSMLGFEEKELCALSCSDFAQPEDSQEDWALFQKLRAGLIDRYSIEKRYVRKDGTRIWGCLSVSLLKPADGGAPLVFAFVEDITERKQAEKSLLEYEKVVEGAEEMIVVLDREYRYLIVNRAFLSRRKMTREQVIGRRAAEVLSPGIFEATLKEKIDQCFQGTFVTDEIRHAYPELGERDLLLSYFPIEGPSGIDRVACVAQDITERKRAEEALSLVSGKLIEAQEKERTRIAREIHDDISQRLALLVVELQQAEDAPPGSAVEVSSRIGEFRKQAFDILKDVQALSHRLHSSKLEYLGMVAAMKAFCREFGDQQNMEIEFRSHGLKNPPPPEISLSLFRVLQEALHNAVKHSGVSHFEVELWEDSDEIHLAVNDLGAGFDIHAAKESPGLGLVSMQERLRLVDGELCVESRPERGTTIHARVPLSSESNSKRAPN